MTKEEVQRSIGATLAYFAVMHRPLIVTEVWQWLWVESGDSCTVYDVVTALASLLAEGKVSEYHGHYALTDAHAEYVVRQQRMILAQKKFARAKRFVAVLRCFPFVRAVAVVNTLALDYARKEADIDLLIVAKHGRLWTVRFFVILFLKLLGVRPRPGDEEDAICVSYFLADISLDISRVNYENDIHNYYWAATVYPVFTCREAGAEYWASSVGRRDWGSVWLGENAWLRDHLPHVEPVCTHDDRAVVDTRFSMIVRWCVELPLRVIGACGERLLRRLQLRMMPYRLRAMEQEDTTDVVMNEHMLKFHANDRRKWWREEWSKRMSNHK